MKNGLFLISLLFFITNISFSQRVVDVPFIKDEQINLDGILDKGEWESSEKLNLDNEIEPWGMRESNPIENSFLCSTIKKSLSEFLKNEII